MITPGWEVRTSLVPRLSPLRREPGIEDHPFIQSTVCRTRLCLPITTAGSSFLYVLMQVFANK